MNQTLQLIAGGALVAVTTAVFAIFWKVGTSRAREDNYKKISERGYAIRRKYFWSLLGASLTLILVGIYAFPYPEITEAKGKASEPHVVKVTASQFSFDLSETRIPRGQVRFDVTSTDVNHGFAIYDEKGMVVSQTQAMPDYVNRLHVNLERPGKYKVWCLEYCGVAHHVMTTEFEVI